MNKNKVEKDENKACFLNENYPIYMVDSQDNLSQIILEIQTEEIIGLDAEWRPNFSTMKELYIF